jgi:hypothetical protein
MTTIDFRPLAIRGVSRIINLPVAGRPGLILTRCPICAEAGQRIDRRFFHAVLLDGPTNWNFDNNTICILST